MDYVFLKEDEKQAIALLEDCVNLGDSQAMVMLAECHTFGRGIKQDVERAKSLIFEAAKKGNKEALSLIGLINDCKEQKRINIGRLMVSLYSAPKLRPNCNDPTGTLKIQSWKDTQDDDELEDSDESGEESSADRNTFLHQVGSLINIVPINAMRIRMKITLNT